MRACSYLVWFLAAGCMSSGSSTSTAGGPEQTALNCDASIAAYCAGPVGCDLTLEAAQHDKRLCSPGFPAAVVACGGYDVVVKSEIDTARRLFYRDGQLVAIVHAQVNNDALVHCLAGPATIDASLCPGREGTPLAACTGS
jgi:hypothetical protein